MFFKLLHFREIDEQEWNRFIECSPHGNIYHLYNYLTHLLEDWKAIMVYEGSELLAILPFSVKRKYLINYAIQPIFSQYIGIIMKAYSDNTYKKYELQKKVIQTIHVAIPKDIHFFQYNFAPEYNYGMALRWLGWNQSIKYTYWVDISKGYEVFIGEAASHVRREIKKAQQNGIRIEVENNPDLVIDILKLAKPELIKKLDQKYLKALSNNSSYFYSSGRSCTLIAYKDSTPIAGMIYFLYKNKMIYYQGSTIPKYKNSGAMSLIISESVRILGGNYTILDFDGSMIEPIERFFRGFGAYPVPYFSYTLNNSPWLIQKILNLKANK
ncbi:MAG: hypothetical protein IPQ10_02440 [Saprospiraceae bacterium]|nr:hypothetical protein [Saprospiraceae bacterium]MBK7796681.1 hypothetical protein [Saprospiraceae bacterium]MBL0259930.1 hypothetical protein [Saprospiraceae bacterium]